MTKKTKMTNKIKPFCVDMSEATEEEIRWLHAKCLESGAIDCNTVEEFLDEKVSYPFKGIDYAGETLSHSEDYLEEWFNNNVITLDRVDSHLGLTPTSEVTQPSVSDSPIKWTIAMQKEGKPLEVGMMALNEGGVEVTINCIGDTSYFLTNDMGMEYCLYKDSVSPFPDEETPEQIKQRADALTIIDRYIDENFKKEDMYEDIKHLFKY